VVIVDNGRCISDTIPYLNRGTYKVIKYAGPFNFSKINNFAVKHADGDYQRIIDWAATIGITVDSARVAFPPYESYHVLNSSDRVKPLAILIDLYNSRVDLQRIHPEVLRGEFKPLIVWADDMLAKNLEETYTALKPYEARYRSFLLER
jgi:hypothetical protein